jgi:hypothetical protein
MTGYSALHVLKYILKEFYALEDLSVTRVLQGTPRLSLLLLLLLYILEGVGGGTKIKREKVIEMHNL